MPQQFSTRSAGHTAAGHSFQLAQSETSAPTTDAAPEEGHAAHEGEAPPGEIPSPGLLFANSVVIAVGMTIAGLIASRNLQRIPRGRQNIAEWIAEELNNFTTGIIGPAGRKYTPLVGTIFIYILLMNLLGLIPGLHSPSSNLSITLALGMVVFIYVQYEGIRASGPVNYVKHFMGPMPLLAVLMLPVELISEVVKPFTLAVRLFGNIFGEDVIMIVLAGLGASSLATSWVPFHVPVLLLALLTSVVQALVFAILTCIYLSLMTQHDHEGHDEEGSHELTHAHATGH